MRLEIVGLGQVLIDRELLRFEHNLALPVAALELAATVLRESSQRQFDTQGGWASGGWLPLAASTKAMKAKRGEDPRILRATERLMNSLTRKYDPEHVERLSPDSVTFGSMVPYGGFHQTGTRKMAKRPPVALNEATKVALIKGMQLALLGKDVPTRVAL